MNEKTMKWSDVVRYARDGNLEPPRRIEKTDDEWKAILTAEQFQITRQKGTERPFSSEACALFDPGIYRCVCCKTELFDASEKFDSGTGWPSFTQPIRANVIGHHQDNTYGMRRIETTCNVCDAHLGHVFPDGPPPSGLRFCINALSLEKVGE